ncbi:hypothetical protein RYX36_034290 [Vicia faba]
MTIKWFIVCLAKMVQSFIEESNNKQTPVSEFARNSCNYFNRNNNDSSDEELDCFGESITSGSINDVGDTLKSLIPCASVVERNLLADTSKIVDKNSKVFKRKNDLRKIAVENISSLGYDSSICHSKWEKHSLTLEVNMNTLMSLWKAQPCTHYMQRGICKFGSACRFDQLMEFLSYSPSASSLSDMPVAPYPIDSSSFELRSELASGSSIESGCTGFSIK